MALLMDFGDGTEMKKVSPSTLKKIIMNLDVKFVPSGQCTYTLIAATI